MLNFDLISLPELKKKITNPSVSVEDIIKCIQSLMSHDQIRQFLLSSIISHCNKLTDYKLINDLNKIITTSIDISAPSITSTTNIDHNDR